MSAGKTTAAKIVTRILANEGLSIVGAKLSGAGRYKDILAIKDAGADQVFDFVDVGLPSSITPLRRYKKSLNSLLNLISSTSSDVAIIEIGASPLEPYNGDIAYNSIKNQIKAIVLCASDPYSVLGVMKSFDITPSLVSGPATNTLGGLNLIDKLCGVNALNIIDPVTHPELLRILLNCLN
jgi:hypothetical protein